mmetsp:Transcript_1201/g.2579  ORF Transcript_1201/g.2579 Transcript_1201/m.2579 type:complete len:229 (+) Transcript_1201:61-747(+)
MLGGRTGSGKTRILHALRDAYGAQVLDLEGLASHRGSSFGWIAQAEQPSTEMFGNLVAHAWRKLDPNKWVFVEDEATNVGKVSTPPVLYGAMRSAPLVVKVVLPLEARLTLLVEDYASEEAIAATKNWRERMEKSISNMERRLGGAMVKETLERHRRGDVRGVASVLLGYYDKLYDKHVANASGTGTGTGERSGDIVIAEADPESTRLDEVALARIVLDRVKAFDASN